ncbi:GGDEF domain-containing protein [Cellulomonas endometrii]|uniref:GGDEF domain-containing protein n=1 Tax=Cellulomonas endometrii TaxID=3036301 RepID=UPI0024ACE082|nr:GGDEF domain-containing protein [Cellulomonas endometrii]
MTLVSDRDRLPSRGDDLSVPPAVVRLTTRVPAWIRAGGNAATVGRLLLGFCGTVAVVGSLVLDADAHEVRALGGTSLVMLFLVVASFKIPWHRAPAATLVFPVLALGALATLGLTTRGITVAFVGLIPLCFVYIGLFHTGRAALVVLPAAWAAYIAMFPMLDSNAAVRLSIYGITWYSIAQILALTMTYQRDLQRRLRYDARTDPLTSLGNRRGLDERLARTGAGDCLVITDLDHFKCVNDTEGHAAGDVVLERFAHLLEQQLRRRDYAARYGGEEFVLILPRTDSSQAMTMLRALRTEWTEERTGVTFSAGVASITEHTPPGSALAAADIALYRAKQAGRDRFYVAPEGTTDTARRRSPE